MATRLETLIGYQLINKTNIGNTALYCTHCQLRRTTPYKLTPLIRKEVRDGDGKILIPTRPATEDDVKDFALCNTKVMDVEVVGRLDNFLKKYTDTTTINNGLAHFNVPKSDLDVDVGEIKTHNQSVKNVVVLVTTFEDLKANGDLLSLYKEKVELEVNPDASIPMEQQRINTYQDLLNAMAFELSGINSYTGKVDYVTVESIRGIVNARITTANRCWEFVPVTVETNEMLSTLQYVENNIEDVKTMADAKALGDYVNLHVPQLPLVRRHWQYA